MPNTHSRSRPIDLLLAVGLAALAGATDVYGLGALHGLYVSFMSGNTTMLGMSLGSGDWPQAAVTAGWIGVFVVGAAFGAVVGDVAGRWQTAAVTLAVAAPLGVPRGDARWTAASLLLAMGALNASMSRVGDVGISLTYMTGALVKLGQGLGKALRGHADHTWVWQAPMWVSLLAGAMGATWLRGELGVEAVWPLPALAGAVGLVALLSTIAGRARPSGL